MVFTAINEAGLDMAYGLASLDIFFAAAGFCLFMVGDQKHLVDNVSYSGSPTEDENCTELTHTTGDDNQSTLRRGSHSQLTIT